MCKIAHTNKITHMMNEKIAIQRVQKANLLALCRAIANSQQANFAHIQKAQ